MQARTRRPWPTCSCTRPTTRCVAALHACAQALVAARDRSSTACLHPPCTISVFQALAEALTTTKSMVGRRLVQCSDFSKKLCAPWPISKCASVGFEGPCNRMVSGITAAWSAAVTGLVERFVDAANEATKVAKKAADVAAAAATKTLNAVKKPFIELKDEIQCATPPPAQRASRGGGASMAPHASRAALWYPCATCRRVEPGATWQGALQGSKEAGPRYF